MVRGETETGDQAPDQRLVQARLLRRLTDRHPRLVRRQQLLEETECEPALLGRPGDVGDRVAPLAHPGHHPRRADRGRRPLAVVLRDQPPLVQRRSVAGLTPTRRAASARVMRRCGRCRPAPRAVSKMAAESR